MKCWFLCEPCFGVPPKFFCSSDILEWCIWRFWTISRLQPWLTCIMCKWRRPLMRKICYLWDLSSLHFSTQPTHPAEMWYLSCRVYPQWLYTHLKFRISLEHSKRYFSRNTLWTIWRWVSVVWRFSANRPICEFYPCVVSLYIFQLSLHTELRFDISVVEDTWRGC